MAHTPADELRQAAATVRQYAHLFEGKAEHIAESMHIAATAWEDCERRGFRRTDTSAGGRILAVARAINGSAR
jgi:hypothetical protein